VFSLNFVVGHPSLPESSPPDLLQIFPNALFRSGSLSSQLPVPRPTAIDTKISLSEASNWLLSHPDQPVPSSSSSSQGEQFFSSPPLFKAFSSFLGVPPSWRNLWQSHFLFPDPPLASAYPHPVPPVRSPTEGSPCPLSLLPAPLGLDQDWFAMLYSDLFFF